MVCNCLIAYTTHAEKQTRTESTDIQTRTVYLQMQAGFSGNHAATPTSIRVHSTLVIDGCLGCTHVTLQTDPTVTFRLHAMSMSSDPRVSQRVASVTSKIKTGNMPKAL